MLTINLKDGQLLFENVFVTIPLTVLDELGDKCGTGGWKMN